MGPHEVRVTMQPDKTLTVDDAEYIDLSRQGLLIYADAVTDTDDGSLRMADSSTSLDLSAQEVKSADPEAGTTGANTPDAVPADSSDNSDHVEGA